MPSYRKLPSGRWQARIRAGGRQQTQSFPSRVDAERWALQTEADMRGHRYVNVRGVPGGATDHLTVTHTPDGLTIQVSADLLTMELAAELEYATREILGLEG